MAADELLYAAEIMLARKFGFVASIAQVNIVPILSRSRWYLDKNGQPLWSLWARA